MYKNFFNDPIIFILNVGIIYTYTQKNFEKWTNKKRKNRFKKSYKTNFTVFDLTSSSPFLSFNNTLGSTLSHPDTNRYPNLPWSLSLRNLRSSPRVMSVPVRLSCRVSVQDDQTVASDNVQRVWMVQGWSLFHREKRVKVKNFVVNFVD